MRQKETCSVPPALQEKKRMMIYGKALEIIQECLLQPISELYELTGYTIKPIDAHEGGRNVVFTCEEERSDPRIIRVAFLADRTHEDILAEVEYVRFLYENGASVSDVVESKNGNLSETLLHNGNRFSVCVFEKAKGSQLAEMGYRYRDGVPLTEHFFNCGKVLGRIHELSKRYEPAHRRHSFFDRYNAACINALIPEALPLLKKKLCALIEELAELEQTGDSFGMVHFDYNDGNYTIDYDSGDITVFDFDNSCFCWYLYDLADLWTHGVGWIQLEPDSQKRRGFMDGYFDTVMEGYRSETDVDVSMLDKLPLFIRVVLMENIVDAFEVMQSKGDEPKCDGKLSYLVRCIEEDIPYKGFFHEIYSCDRPFRCDERIV